MFLKWRIAVIEGSYYFAWYELCEDGRSFWIGMRGKDMADDLEKRNDILDDRRNEPPKKFYYRQLVLLPEIAQRQVDCNHTLSFPSSTTIICSTCGAVWIK